MEKEVKNVNEANEVHANYVPFCAPHTSCCYYKGCPAEWGYDGKTGNEWFIRCDKNCK